MCGLKRNVWEGWTPQDFIDALSMEIDMIMSGNSWKRPFQTREDMCRYIADAQPYYKERISEVEEYFITRYGL